MSPPQDHNFDLELEAYLDGVMTPEERTAFEAQLRRHPEVARAVKLQAMMDDTLTNLYAPPTITPAEIEALIASSPTSDGKETQSAVAPGTKHGLANSAKTKTQHPVVPSNPVAPNNRRRLVLVSLAAAVAWAMVGWHFFRGNGRDVEPYFEQQPLTSVYGTILESGFRPYYECHDADRFATTFQQRQGIALQLKEMPAGTGMLGLSYAGGLSRDTTAILCRVDDQPVIVFVDRIDADSGNEMANQNPAASVFRQEVGELVMYEVSPLQASRVLKYLHVP